MDSIIRQIDEPTPIIGAEEARRLTDEIKGAVEVLWAMLYMTYQREIWRPLGYANWREYVQAEFNMSQSRAYQILDQGRLIHEINAAISEAAGEPISTMVEITEREARDLRAVQEVVTDRISRELPGVPREQLQAAAAQIIHEERVKAQTKAEAAQESRAVAERLGLREDTPEDKAALLLRSSIFRSAEDLMERVRGMSVREVCRNIRSSEREDIEALPQFIDFLQKFVDVAR